MVRPQRRLPRSCASLEHGAEGVGYLTPLCGGVLNAGLVVAVAFPYAVLSRFLTGAALAGIYPLGMKLIVSWARQRSGFALGL